MPKTIVRSLPGAPVNAQAPASRRHCPSPNDRSADIASAAGWRHAPCRRQRPLDALAAGPATAAPLPVRLVAARHRGRPGADDDAGAGGHRLCGGLGRARHPWPVRHHRRAAGLCAVRAQPHPGDGAGFVAGRADPGGAAAARGRRPGARGGAGRRDGHRRGPDRRRRRAGQAGLHHRTAVQAHPLRLHERHRAGGHRQPAAQVVRHCHRGRRPARTGRGLGAGAVGRAAQRRGLRHRRGVAGADPAAEALAARARHAHRHRRRHGRGRTLRPGPQAWRERARHTAAGAAVTGAAVDRLGRPDAGAGRRAGRGAGGLCRHQRAVAHLCAAPAPAGGPEPGDGGAGRDQPGGGPVPGLSRSAAARRARRWPRPRARNPR